jgi:carboxyl-terminal processing protease
MILTDPGTGQNFGYIKIPSFYRDFNTSFMGKDGRNVTDDVAAALNDLKKQGTSGLIIDLRNNGGGALKDAVGVSGLFIDQGPVVQVKSSAGAVQVLKDDDSGVAYGGPLVVLVNRFSASASEIFAAALQDYKRAFILGTDHTYGKGTVQTILDLDRSVPFRNMDRYKPLGALKITTQKFYRVSGGSTQFKGVEADLLLPDRLQYVKAGEKYIDYSMPWDTVPATSYDPWEDSGSLQLEQIKGKSRERIAASDSFKEIMKSSATVKQHQEEIARITRGPKFADMPSASNGMNVSTTPKAASVSSSDTDMNVAVASILPRINSARRTGSPNRGSSEPRSRSPAVVSTAR